MNAKISYVVEYILHPWYPRDRSAGIRAWCLTKVVTPEMGTNVKRDVVAMFNLDSEAELFMTYVVAGNMNGQLVTVDPQFVELLTLQHGRVKR